MLSQNTVSTPRWLPWILAIAGFWFSSGLVLDLLVMPVMQVSGMTTQTAFATVGYTLFWSFNRVELLCAALLLTGILALRRPSGEFDINTSGSRCRWALVIGFSLLSLAFIETYLLTPEMSGLALSLDTFNQGEVLAPAMNWMHGLYWVLDCVKFASLALLTQLCYSDLRREVFRPAAADLSV